MRLLTERVQAMIEIWTKDEAEYHGQLVNFDLLQHTARPAGARQSLVLQQPSWEILMTKRGRRDTRASCEPTTSWWISQRTSSRSADHRRLRQCHCFHTRRDPLG